MALWVKVLGSGSAPQRPAVSEGSYVAALWPTDGIVAGAAAIAASLTCAMPGH